MVLDTARERIERLLTQPGQELGRGARFVRFQIELWRFCARRLRENNVMAMSAALSFRTIFALIPVLVLAFLVLKSVGVLADSNQSMQRLLDASGFAQIAVFQEGEAQPESETLSPDTAGAPTTQSTRVINVADEIQKLVGNVTSKLTFERLGPVGGALLIWTALTLLTTVERSLNRIFEAPRGRALAASVLLYWSAMTLGPIALVAASYLGRQAVTTFQDAPGVAWVLVAMGWLGPIIVGVIVLAMLYVFLPNTTVPFRAAIGASIVAVPLWMVAKWGFALYVEHLVVKGNLYGVLGVLPLFLLWLNFSWLIFLFGAELAHTSANLDRMRSAERGMDLVLGPTDALAVAACVAGQYTVGRGPVAIERIVGMVNLPGEAVQKLVNRLIAAGILCPVENQTAKCFVLARPADRIRVADILAIGDPRADGAVATGFDGPVAAAVAAVHGRTQASLAEVTLADALAAGPVD